jgi:hypothetical protein
MYAPQLLLVDGVELPLLLADGVELPLLATQAARPTQQRRAMSLFMVAPCTLMIDFAEPPKSLWQVVHSSNTTSASPVFTALPTLQRIPLTRPATGAATVSSIFIASTITSGWPAVTV